MNASPKRILVAGALLCAVLLVFGWLSGIEPRETDPALMRFSNTQDWDPTLLRHLPGSRTPEKRAVTDAYVSAIELPPPPANMSETTAAELQTLHAYIELRDETRADIEAEHRGFDGFRFGTYRPWAGEATQTRTLLDHALGEYAPVIFAFKERFDRVRPSYLDQTITTMFPIPGHPAYPSGHAAQVYLIAGILAELDPENAQAYFADAVRIARNREIAGVHYPSDSSAGATLAAQFLPLYLETEEARMLLEAARTEWERHRN